MLDFTTFALLKCHEPKNTMTLASCVVGDVIKGHRRYLVSGSGQLYTVAITVAISPAHPLLVTLVHKKK